MNALATSGIDGGTLGTIPAARPFPLKLAVKLNAYVGTAAPIAAHHAYKEGGKLMTKHSLPRVVIVGGGFGGLAAARALRNAPLRVTLIDRSNHHLFQPLLYQV